MLPIINKVPLGGTNLCKGDEKKDTNGYDALINAENVKAGHRRLVLMIQYGLGN